MGGTNLFENLKLFKWALHFLLPYLKIIILLSCIILISTSIGMLMPLLNKQVIDEGILKNNLSYVLILTAISISLNIFDRSLQLIQANYYAKISTHLPFKLQLKVFKKLLNLKIDFYNNANATQLLSTVNLDINNICTIANRSMLFIISDLLRVIGSLIGLFLISPILALLGLIIIPLKIIINIKFSKVKSKAHEELLKANKEFSSWYGDAIGGVKEIKLLGIEEKFIKKYINLQRPIIKTNTRFILLDQWRNFWDGNLSELGTELTFIIGAVLVFNQSLTFGALFAFTTYLSLVYAPISNLINLQYLFSGFFPSAKHLTELLNQPEEEQKKPNHNLCLENSSNSSNPLISFQNVSFTYPNGEEALKNISFSINKGEKVAIIGANGSGKTTLFNLLLGFYRPNDGEILINNLPIESIPLKKLRQMIATVTQETYLFSTTIQENLGLCFKKKQKNFQNSSHEAQRILTMLKELPAGLETSIGRNGVKLSGGQRQKIALARALVRDSKIILMDEATSQLDIHSERETNELLYQMGKEVTALIITHRPYILEYVDQIIVLKEGKITAIGTHHSLLESAATYQQILTAHNC